MDNFPEKILLVQDDNIIKDYWVLENLTDCKDMEYIRKDVFINKVCEFIQTNVREYHKSGVFHVAEFIKDLRKAMKE